MNIRRKTLKEAARFSGPALHSGTQTQVVVGPAENGIWFSSGSDRFEAIPENVTDTTRCTRLGTISTVEHLMSALGGLEITDVEINVSGNELPALDGSAKLYAEQFLKIGFEPLRERAGPTIFTRVFVQEDGLKIAVAKGTGHWRYVYDAGGTWPRKQSFETTNVVADYLQEIAPARTFALGEEVDALLSAGLGKGLSAEDVLIVAESAYEGTPRFAEEPARHKLLDLVGDLYLCGLPISALDVTAERTGHRVNVQAAHLIREALRSPSVSG